ncbi:MAG TPA: XdhC family protein [Streptosporangiaceae bacterium]|nr:XdhC family protein [Streptosporangiaceae bacterium]
MNSWEVMEHAAELARRGAAFALATVVWRQGPSSSQQGSRAIITADGELHGWIGGACAEPAVIRAARHVIATGSAELLLLGNPEQFGGAVPDGVAVIPISCQSEGALEVYIEPVVPVPHVVVVGRSPMAQTLAALARALGWHAELIDGADFATARAAERSLVVVATQGHDDEGVLERAVAAKPAYLGLVGSRKRGAAVLGYLADRGVPQAELDRVKVPAGLDLGSTTHPEIAVAILAELVQLRASGALAGGGVPVSTRSQPAATIDPVCGMTVSAGADGPSLEHAGVTYYFCCSGCRDAFAKDPAAHAQRLADVTDMKGEARC